MPGNGEYAFLQRFLPANPTPLESGAHDGLETVEAAEFFPHARLIAVEPHPHVFGKLQVRLRDCLHCTGRATSIHAALGERDGTDVFYVTHNGSDSLDTNNPDWGTDAQSSLLKPLDQAETHKFSNYSTPITIRVRSLSSLTSELNVSLDYMEMDMQGAELMVLRGAGHVLESITAIKTECIPPGGFYEGAATFQQQHEFLADAGFHLIFYVSRGRKWYGHVHNALYINKLAMDITRS